MSKMFRILLCSLVMNTALGVSSAHAQTDALNIGVAAIVNAPDVRAWPITTAITKVSFLNGVTRIEFTKHNGPDRWPDVTPAGWDGPLQYTLWLFVKQNGNWTGSAFIQFWNTRDGSGSATDPDVPSRYHLNWYYASRWAPIFGHGPLQPGESIGFMVTSGNQRDNVGPNSVRERSNIVVFAATDSGEYTFDGTTPTPPPTPPPTPAPGPPGPPGPQGPKGDPGTSVSVDLSGIYARLDALEGKVTVLQARPILTICEAKANLGAIRIPLSCVLR
jgi:hypothetical protein